jgi:hypothetical protein
VLIRSVKDDSILNQKLKRGSMKFYSRSARSAQLRSGEKNLEKTHVRSVSEQHLVEVLKKSWSG